MKAYLLPVLSLMISSASAFNPGLTASIDWSMMD